MASTMYVTLCKGAFILSDDLHAMLSKDNQKEGFTFVIINRALKGGWIKTKRKAVMLKTGELAYRMQVEGGVPLQAMVPIDESYPYDYIHEQACRFRDVDNDEQALVIALTACPEGLKAQIEKPWWDEVEDGLNWWAGLAGVGKTYSAALADLALNTQVALSN